MNRLRAYDLCGVEMKFSKSSGTLAPDVSDRALDHIGFEVKNLQAFCKKLGGRRREVRPTVQQNAA